MSLFRDSPPDAASPITSSRDFQRCRGSLFNDEPATTTSTSSALFADDPNDNANHSGDGLSWDMPTPRKPKRRADLLQSLLPASEVPESYIETFDAVLAQEEESRARVGVGGLALTLAAARLGADEHARINSIVSGGSGDEITLGRNEFNVLLALIGLAQEGETPTLDGVDERRRNLPPVKLPGLLFDRPVYPNASELAAKPPQQPVTPSTPSSRPSCHSRKPSMDYSEDPWAAPAMHKGHNHSNEPQVRPSGAELATGSALNGDGNGNGDAGDSLKAGVHGRTTSAFTTRTTAESGRNSILQQPTPASANANDWDFPDANGLVGPGFGPQPGRSSELFATGTGQQAGDQAATAPSRMIGSERSGSSVEENITVALMPEKEGMFMFQHHNYEVSSTRKGSKVIRRYSDFVWLLDCLYKRYPFRLLPLLPPKRVAVNGNHLSNDGAFIEKRRRGLARFLNALIRHPVLGQEQLVTMFLTVPTLAAWRKQATISVQDEFSGRTLPVGLEDSLSPAIEDLFSRTRTGVRRSAELYISLCNVMDRLVKRSEGVAADHARIAMTLNSLTGTTADTYAIDISDVPMLNDGLQAMSKYLRTSQSLMEDESRAWSEGVLEDLKRQRDALVAMRELFDRRERLDTDNIAMLERRIQNNETKLVNLRAKPEGLVKPGEIEKVVESIIKDKESIVNQHNRSIFVKEALRDELVNFQSTQYHVSHWNQDWAQERVKYSEMLAENWRRMLDELDGMPLGD